jgi:hypothetical protein
LGCTIDVEIILAALAWKCMFRECWQSRPERLKKNTIECNSECVGWPIWKLFNVPSWNAEPDIIKKWSPGVSFGPLWLNLPERSHLFNAPLKCWLK